jgi:hypothetical protein
MPFARTASSISDSFSNKKSPRIFAGIFYGRRKNSGREPVGVAFRSLGLLGKVFFTGHAARLTVIAEGAGITCSKEPSPNSPPKRDD